MDWLRHLEGEKRAAVMSGCNSGQDGQLVRLQDQCSIAEPFCEPGVGAGLPDHLSHFEDLGLT